MTVSINVDELDILSVAEGQTAAVTLDALEGETFEGTITYVAGTASSGSSSAKYPVKITLKKTEDMKLGLSLIHISSKTRSLGTNSCVPDWLPCRKKR